LSLYLGPIVGAMLSVVFLGEAPTMIHLIGGTLSLGGTWLSSRSGLGQSR
jgi:drug/metabolite transporter (DMT)-like permease